MTTDLRDAGTPLARRIGLRIRAALAGQDVTQEELAERIGKSQQWVSRRITGATPVDASDVELIADALGISIHDLLPPVTDPDLGLRRVAGGAT